ncbi:hypothetical protein C808_01156 [Lachnospiraceae bacterium M18-1]|nr:hypothetical protein C808_01156 [Lachnospiraceae bacterium M18-1]
MAIIVDITRIKDLREDSDISQKQLADVLGISQRAYSHYENGTRKIPLDILLALADYYNCSTDYLLGRTKEKKFN